MNLISDPDWKRDDDLCQQAFGAKALDNVLVIDAHAHLGEISVCPLIDHAPASLLAAMDRMGVNVCGISSILAVCGDAEHGNREVASALQAYPGRFLGYMVVDIGYPERIPAEMARCLAEGFRGIKIYSRGIMPGLDYDHPNYDFVYQFASEHQLPVLAHTWGEELKVLDKVAASHPELTLLLAHTGSVGVENYIELAKKHTHVYLETCFSSCPRGLIETLVEEGLEEKVLWGSDAPTVMDAAHQLGRIVFAKIPEEIKRMILGGNARQVLGL